MKIKTEEQASDYLFRRKSLIGAFPLILFLLVSHVTGWIFMSTRGSSEAALFVRILILFGLILSPALILTIFYRFFIQQWEQQKNGSGVMIRQLEERISFYQKIDDSNLGGYLVFSNTNFQIIDANAMASIILRTAHDLLIGADIREIFRDIQWLEKDLPFHQSEIEVSVDSGLKTFLLASMGNLELPNQEHAIMSFVDISQQVNTEQALQKSRSRFQSLFHSIPIGLFQSTTDGLIVEANETFARILNYPDIATLLTAHIEDIYEDVKERKKMTYALSITNSSVVKEARLKCYSGEFIWARITAHTLSNEWSNIRYIEGAIQDITDLKTRELEEESMNKIASRTRQMDTIGTLAGGVAHEFNNILAGMKLKIHICKARHVDKEIQNDLEYFEGAIVRADNSVEGLLAATGEPLDQPSVIDINDIVSAVIHEAQHSNSETIKWIEYLSTEPIKVWASSSQLKFVLAELLRNASSAIKNEGKVTVLSTRKIPGRVMSGIIPLYEEPHATIIVQDTGRGMAPEMVDRVFEPFYTTEEFGSNHGMGLTKSYGIIRQHQGGITCHSKPGVGTTIMIFLPLSD